MRPMRHAIAFALACALIPLHGVLPAQAQDARDPTCFDGNQDITIPVCTKHIARNPNDAYAYAVRAGAYVDKGEYNLAIADYSKAIKLEGQVYPRNTYYADRGDTYVYLHNYDMAIADYNRAIKLNPKGYYFYESRGHVYLWKKEFDRAILDYNEAIRLVSAPDGLRDASPYHSRCTAFIWKGAYDRAISDCGEAIRINQNFATAYGERGFAYMKKGDYDKAIVDLNEAIRLEPEPGFFRSRGTVYTRKGDFDRALADFNEAIRLDPQAARAYVRRGQMWEAKGERQKAIDDYVKALSLRTWSLFVRDEQADARRRLAALNAQVSVPPPKLTLDPMPPPKRAPPLKLTLDLGSKPSLSSLDPGPSPSKRTAPPLTLDLGSKLNPPSLDPGPPSPKLTAPLPKPALEAVPPPSPPPGLQPDRRVALAIGNAAYRKVDPLPNPRKDAADIAAALKAAGFAEVVVLHDLGLKEMQRALAEFEEKAGGADWAVVYYGGHAIQVDGKNFLVPVDAALKSPSDVEDETLVLDRVLARIAAAGKLRLVILDACRTNPFRRLWATAKPAAGSQVVARDIAERGLRRYETTQRNLLIAYAAAEGQVALDGPSGGNSPYVKALLRHLATAGLEINKLFRLVGDDVMAETGGKQQPFEYGSRSGEDLFFRAASK